MRAFGLLAISVVACCLLGAAQSKTTNLTRDSQNNDSSPTWRMSHSQGPELDLFRSEGAHGVDCFTMRTYTVARERPKSDTTRLVRYSTCPRADWKLQFRNTDEKLGNPDN